jgi:xanthine/CO dehydrogenase XdhC/CoxF family maturation factor
MRELLDELLGWLRAGRPAALATLVRATGSAPRPPGAAMVVGPDGRVLGSLSGGCVEGAVYELGQRVLASGAPELVTFGYSDDDAFAVGLSCGGQLEVFVQRLGRRVGRSSRQWPSRWPRVCPSPSRPWCVLPQGDPGRRGPARGCCCSTGNAAARSAASA